MQHSIQHPITTLELLNNFFNYPIINGLTQYRQIIIRLSTKIPKRAQSQIDNNNINNINMGSNNSIQCDIIKLLIQKGLRQTLFVTNIQSHKIHDKIRKKKTRGLRSLFIWLPKHPICKEFTLPRKWWPLGFSGIEIPPQSTSYYSSS